MLQSRILRHITERLLRACGIAKGMRVLDLGCGAGDVSLMAAEMVGPAGSVLGMDQNPEIIELAARRARQAGFAQVSFEVSPIDAYHHCGPFDAIVGRYILHHLPDPVATVRHAARMLAPGGVIAFHEIAANIPPRSYPEVPMFSQTMDWLVQLFSYGVAQADAGTRLVQIFVEAGLPMPEIFEESIVGGGAASPMYQWMAATVRSLAPRIVQLGIATAQEMRVDMFAQRLEENAVRMRSQIVSPPQYCAWARKIEREVRPLG